MSAKKSGAERFFESALEIFKQAAARRGLISRNYIIAGCPIRLEFAGAAMVQLTRAFSHLETRSEVTPQLTVHVWDSESTDTCRLERAWTEDICGTISEISTLSGRRFYSEFHDAAGIRYMLDDLNGIGLYCIEDARNIPPYEQAGPMRPLLHAWFHRRPGLVPVHAGAVGLESRGVLLVGKGGRGKSCTAISCLESNLLYASDDFCVLSRTPEWTVHSMYGTGKLNRCDVGRFPYLFGRAANTSLNQDEKEMYFLNEHFPSKMSRHFPISAILMPKVSATGETRIAPLSPTLVYKELAMTTISMAPAAPPAAVQALRRFAELVREVPCWELKLGNDSTRIPLLILDLLDRVSKPAKAPKNANSL